MNTKHQISQEDRARGGRIAAANRVKRAKEARLASLDARYEGLVDRIAAGYSAQDARAITAGRNSQAGIRSRRGLGPLPTVKSEARRLAENQLLRLLDSRAGDPFVATLAAEIAEAYALRCELEVAI